MLWFRSHKYLGKKFGEYTLVQIVGSGRYGLCYLAMSETGSKVILKKFKSGIRRKRQLIAHEAVALSIITDHRAPSLLGVINQKSFYGFVLDCKPGHTLHDMIFKHNHNFSEKELYAIGLQLISIVKHLHKNGIVHRDIRLPNILIDKQDVYLIDFGLARFEDGRQYKFDLDYSYLGDVFLYVLYSSFQKRRSRKKIPWYSELPLPEDKRYFLERLMGLQPIYDSIDQIENDFIAAFGK